MKTFTLALFGEAEKGNYRTAYFCRNLPQLVDFFGNPPPHSRGLHYAVQALLYHRDLIFFRVKEEGFSYQDYLTGLNLLQRQNISQISAICLPGVGNSEILDAIAPICALYHSILITNEADFYDYITEEAVH
jgi:hypothetical protein